MLQQQQQPKPRGRRKKIRTEPIRPICPQCEKQFSNQSALTKHKLTHSDERKFACQQCSKAFKRHDHLTGHMQTHSNRKPFNCTIQGCDKTYCDARSLRRHKENIHHIITPKDNSNSHQQHSSSPNGSAASPSGAQQEQSHLLRRRIQRLNSDPGAPYQSVADCASAAATPTDPARRIVAPIQPSEPHQQQLHQQQQQQQQQHQQQHYQHPQASYSADYALTQQFSFEFDQMQAPSNGLQHNQSHHINHSHNQVSSSGYVTPTTLHPPNQPASAMATFSSNTGAQHFSFDFNNNQLAAPTLDSSQQFCNSNGAQLAHSTDSLTDSSLGLSIQYEQSTPLTDGSQQQQSNHHYAQQQQQQQQQPAQQTYQQAIVSPSFTSPTSVPHEPSHLLQRRIQRLHSDPGAPYQGSNANDSSAGRLDNLNARRLADSIQPQHHQHYLPQASYSADYALTQQFSFDFDHMQAPSNGLHHNQSHHISHSRNQVTSSGYVTPTTLHSPCQPGSAMADFATNTGSQHFSFDFNNNQLGAPSSIESGQQFCASNGGPLGHSVDNLDDSSLGLSMQYEQPTPLTDGSQHQQSSTQTTTVQHFDQQQQTYQQAIVSSPSFSSPTPVQHEPSHLLQRRIQRLHSDPGAPYQESNANDTTSASRHHQHYLPQTSYSADYRALNKA